MEQLLTVPQVAAVLQCSPRHVYGLLYGGQLASVKVGALRRVRAADLDVYVLSLTVEATDVAAQA